MIVHEIQLRYVIRDKIQSETKSEILSGKKFYQKKNSRSLSQTEFCLGFPVHFFKVVSDKLMLIITKRYIHTAIKWVHEIHLRYVA